MIEEEIHWFIHNFKYFTAILAQCFNSPTLSLQSVSMSSFWLRPNPPPKHQECQQFDSDPPPPSPKCADVILERSIKKNIGGASCWTSGSGQKQMQDLWLHYSISSRWASASHHSWTSCIPISKGLHRFLWAGQCYIPGSGGQVFKFWGEKSAFRAQKMTN